MSRSSMDARFLSFLTSNNITQETITVLEDEMIINKEIFVSLREEHFTKLLPHLKVGQHVGLKRLWDTGRLKSVEKYCSTSSDCDSVTATSMPYRSRSPTNSPGYSSNSSRSLSPDGAKPERKLVTSDGAKPERKLITSDKDIKELTRLYKANAVARFNKGSTSIEPKKSSEVKNMKVLLGGMVFDKKQNKGIRRKYLPEPNPTKVEFEKDASLVTVFEKSIELYYKEMNVSTKDVMLADSVGNIINIENQDSWKLGDYYSVNQYTPSRHKLYTVVNVPKAKEGDKDMCGKEEDMCGKEEDMCGKEGDKDMCGKEEYREVITDPVIKPCYDCGRDYRTYIADTVCVYKDLNFSYVDPQLLCPLCDPKGWGAFMNEDLFPELIPINLPRPSDEK